MGQIVRLMAKNYGGWSGYCLTNGELELGIIPDIGGRIISLQVQGEELLYVDKKHLGETFDLGRIDNLSQFKEKFGFRLWGGDKTWVAPEKNWIRGIPPLHLDAGKYTAEVYENAIQMTSPVDQETGLQIIRRVAMLDNGMIDLQQCFINRGTQRIQCGIWNVTQLLHPFHIYFPSPKRSLIPDMRFVASVRDKDILTSDIGDWVKISCEKPLQFKYGSNIFQGKVLAIRESFDHTIAMIKTFFVNPQEKYPHGDMVEVYNSDEQPYLELEVLSPLVFLQPADQITHQQQWTLIRLNKKASLKEVLSHTISD